MKKYFPILPFLFAALHFPAISAASPFDSLLRDAVDGAARSLIRSPQESAPQPQESGSGSTSAAPLSPSQAAAPGCPRIRGNAFPPLGPRPSDYQPAVLWPEENGCSFSKFADLKFEAARAQKKAFDDASRVRCSDCEGGYSYDAWAHFFLNRGGNGDQFKKFDEALISLKPGRQIAWKGKKFSGTVQATGEHPIGPFPCRQYHWTLKDGNRIAAEREGLYCEYKGDYESAPKWRPIM